MPVLTVKASDTSSDPLFVLSENGYKSLTCRIAIIFYNLNVTNYFAYYIYLYCHNDNVNSNQVAIKKPESCYLL